MGIAERKEREKEELRDKILDAARAIVLTEGFEALTMRKIADRIEYSPATIYLHFEGRDDLGMALCRGAFSKLLAAFLPAAAIPDPYERVFAIGRSYVRFAMANPEEYRLMFMLEPKFSSELMELSPRKGEDPDEPGDRAYNFLLDTVKELVDSGRFRKVDPELAAQVLWMGVHGIASMKLSMPDYEGFGDTDALVDLMQDAIMHGLLAKT